MSRQLIDYTEVVMKVAVRKTEIKSVELDCSVIGKCITGVDLDDGALISYVPGLCMPHYCFIFRYCPLCGQENPMFAELADLVAKEK